MMVVTMMLGYQWHPYEFGAFVIGISTGFGLGALAHRLWCDWRG